MNNLAATTRRVEVALAGRPNAGKTSLLMHLTGAPQHPINFPGTSVERMASEITVGDTLLCAVDLPGIGSLSPVSRDERVALDYLRGPQKPDAVCVVLDATKLSVELHLLRELATLGTPLIVALNKNDIARRGGRPVDVARLGVELGLPVVETDGHTGAGTAELRAAMARATDLPHRSLSFDPDSLTTLVQRGSPPERTWTDRLDAVLLHRVFGLPILALVTFGIFQMVFTVADPFMTWIEDGQELLGGAVGALLEPGALRSFLVDGLINGVGSILVFLPQIVLLIALITLLEATGYMARAAFLLDRLLGRFGLSGRSFVPLASSFACAIPGILASRIIDNERDRLATIVVAPLMSCSARLPVYVVLIGAFFPIAWGGAVLFGLYLLGIVVAALVALALRRTMLRGGQSMLLMELPAYGRPSWRVVRSQVVTACREFVVMAGTVIFATAIVIWLLSYYPRPAEIHERFERERATAASIDPSARGDRIAGIDRAEATAYFEQSYLARIGKTLQPAFAPAGFDWRTTVGIVAAFPARELIVPTLGILYSVGDVDPGDYDLASLGQAPEQGDGLRHRLRSSTGPDGRPAFDALVALALMVFFALCSQCAATLGAIRRETRSIRWPVFTFSYMTALAWLGAVAVYQGGRLLGFGLP